MTEPRRDTGSARRLAQVRMLTEPAIRQAIWKLAPPAGSHGLDAGCGTGHVTLWLAEAAGENVRVTGMDTSQTVLDVARANARTSAAGGAVEFVQGDLRKPPFPAQTFDWVWCADTLWPGVVAENPAETVEALARSVKPGGTVALCFWTEQMMLPGYPALEARMKVAIAESLPYVNGIPPERQFMRALGWLRDAGLTGTRAVATTASVSAPLSRDRIEAVQASIDMFADEIEGRLSPGDADLLKRLTSPDSADYLPARDDYCWLAVYTLFTGKKAG